MKNFIIPLGFIIILMFFNSCGKKGCIDTNATNFCTACKNDEGSCKYTGKVVIWWDSTFAKQAITGGAIQIKIFEDNTALLGSAYLYKNAGTQLVYCLSAPTCGTADAITIDRDLGNYKNFTLTCKIQGQCSAGSCIWLKTKAISFEGGKCVPFQLTW